MLLRMHLRNDRFLELAGHNALLRSRKIMMSIMECNRMLLGRLPNSNLRYIDPAVLMHRCSSSAIKGNKYFNCLSIPILTKTIITHVKGYLDQTLNKSLLLRPIAKIRSFDIFLRRLLLTSIRLSSLPLAIGIGELPLTPLLSFPSSSVSRLICECIFSKSVGFFSMTILKLFHCLSSKWSSGVLAAWFSSMNLSNSRQRSYILSFVCQSTLPCHFIQYYKRLKAVLLICTGFSEDGEKIGSDGLLYRYLVILPGTQTIWQIILLVTGSTHPYLSHLRLFPLFLLLNSIIP